MIKKPKVGTWIEVSTDYSKYKRGFAGNVHSHYVTVGKVVESQEWEGENTFALLTTDRKMPIKTIDMRWVTKIAATGVDEDTSAAFEVKMNEAEQADRTFQIKGGNLYTVTRKGFSWSCDCMAGSRGRRCKHVVEAQGIEAKEKASA